MAAGLNPGVHSKRRAQWPRHDVWGMGRHGVPATGANVRFLTGTATETLHMVFPPRARHDPRDAGEALHIQGAIGLAAPLGFSLTGHGIIRLILGHRSH